LDAYPELASYVQYMGLPFVRTAVLIGRKDFGFDDLYGNDWAELMKAGEKFTACLVWRSDPFRTFFSVFVCHM